MNQMSSAVAGASAHLRKLSSKTVWLVLWAVGTSAGWLLPNHYYPWIGFHTDAWIAASFLAGSAWTLVSSRSRVPCHGVAVLGLSLAVVPFFQFASGLLPFAGQAWTSSLYVLGFSLTVMMGAYAEESSADTAVDGLLLAIGIAAVFSVGIQLYQWLSLTGADIWVMPLPADRPRPFGNLVQPNIMATFLLWGLVATAWAALNARIRPGIALLMAIYLLTGVALTQSRTGIAAVLLVFVSLWYWCRRWPELRQMTGWATILTLYFVCCLLALEPLSRALLLEHSYDAVARVAGADIRLPVYRMFLDAATLRPWFGYGWSSAAPAQFAVAESHPAFFGIFQHSHNIFLDLILWVGLPFGVLVSIALSFYFIRLFIRLRNPQDALLFVFLAVLGLHSMLELPHQCAYMLLPAGLVLGALHARVGISAVWLAPRTVVLSLWMLAATAFGLLARDYLRIEQDFLALRFEKAYNIKPPEDPPRIVLLTHLQEFIKLGRSLARTGMSDAELEQLRRGADAFPSPSNLYLYTAALALNGRADAAQLRMRKMARIMEPGAYEQMGRAWNEQSKRNQALARVAWLPSDVAPSGSQAP